MLRDRSEIPAVLAAQEALEAAAYEACSCCRKCGASVPCRAVLTSEHCEGLCFCGTDDLDGLDTLGDGLEMPEEDERERGLADALRVALAEYEVLEDLFAEAQGRIEELEAELGRASSQRAYQVGAEAVSIEWTSRELGHIAFVIDDDDKARKVELLLSALGFVPKRIHRATDWSALAAETTPEQLADTLQAAFASGVQQGRVLERRGGAS